MISRVLLASGALALFALCRADGWIGSRWVASGDGYELDVKVANGVGAERLDVTRFDIVRGNERVAMRCSYESAPGILMSYVGELNARCDSDARVRPAVAVTVGGKFPHLEVLQHGSLTITRMPLVGSANLPAAAAAQAPPDRPVTRQPGKRVALLIGNHDYSVGRLVYPAQDVGEIETALRAVGFAKPTVLLNGNQRSMKRAIQDFGDRARDAEIAVFYYSGHATQSRGENYLLPVGSRIEREADYDIEGVAVSALLRQLAEASPKAGIVILDACRDNPVARFKSAVKGLAGVAAPSRTMIAFATAPNTTTPDNGLYARVLARHMQRAGIELLDVFRDTTAEVMRLTFNRQEPRISEVTLTDRIYLKSVGDSGASGEVHYYGSGYSNIDVGKPQGYSYDFSPSYSYAPSYTFTPGSGPSSVIELLRTATASNDYIEVRVPDASFDVAAKDRIQVILEIQARPERPGGVCVQLEDNIHARDVNGRSWRLVTPSSNRAATYPQDVFHVKDHVKRIPVPLVGGPSEGIPRLSVFSVLHMAGDPPCLGNMFRSTLTLQGAQQ